MDLDVLTFFEPTLAVGEGGREGGREGGEECDTFPYLPGRGREEKKGWGGCGTSLKQFQ